MVYSGVPLQRETKFLEEGDEKEQQCTWIDDSRMISSAIIFVLFMLLWRVKEAVLSLFSQGI